VRSTPAPVAQRDPAVSYVPVDCGLHERPCRGPPRGSAPIPAHRRREFG